jgi:hypothetical protein
MNQLANEFNREYGQHIKQLPDGLNDLQKTNYADPITKTPIEYSPETPTRYEPCTIFSTDSPNERLNGAFSFWAHTAGHKCFEFDAAEQVPQAPYY